MRFAKVVDGSLEFAPKMFETDDGKVITNSPELYAMYGYKPIVLTDPPEIPEGYENVYRWEDSENGCLQVWEQVEISTEDAEHEDTHAALELLGVTPKETEE